MIGQTIVVTGLMMASVAMTSADSNDHKRRLTSNEISTALVGNLVRYSPPGSADMGVHEEFHEGGAWAGIRYGRGPIPFSGEWKVSDDQLCVYPEQGLGGDRRARGWFCRIVWRDDQSGRLLMEHLNSYSGPQELNLQPLPE